MAEVSVVKFVDPPRLIRIVPVKLIKFVDGRSFAPACVDDVPTKNVSVKWQKSDDFGDGYYEAEILFNSSKFYVCLLQDECLHA